MMATMEIETDVTRFIALNSTREELDVPIGYMRISALFEVLEVEMPQFQLHFDAIELNPSLLFNSTLIEFPHAIGLCFFSLSL